MTCSHASPRAAAPRGLLRAPLVIALAAGLAIAVATAGPARGADLLRGDCNADGRVDISDPIYALNYLFAGGGAPPCIPVADANGDGRLDISDCVRMLDYLFGGAVEFPPFTPAEITACGGEPEPTVRRRGRLIDLLDPGYEIDGFAEELSNGKIRLRDFHYNGLGDPQVVVLLTEVLFANEGLVISGDLRRESPYEGETLEFPLPDGATSQQYSFVAIWCDAFPLTFGYAELLFGP